MPDPMCARPCSTVWGRSSPAFDRARLCLAAWTRPLPAPVCDRPRLAVWGRSSPAPGERHPSFSSALNSPVSSSASASASSSSSHSASGGSSSPPSSSAARESENGSIHGGPEALARVGGHREGSPLVRLRGYGKASDPGGEAMSRAPPVQATAREEAWGRAPGAAPEPGVGRPGAKPQVRPPPGEGARARAPGTTTLLYMSWIVVSWRSIHFPKKTASPPPTRQRLLVVLCRPVGILACTTHSVLTLPPTSSPPRLQPRLYHLVVVMTSS